MKEMMITFEDIQLNQKWERRLDRWSSVSKKGCGFLVLLLLICFGTVSAAEKVTLQLAWKHQFQFAGYYAALEKEFYRQAGLDVDIIEGGEGKFAREEVLQGRAQYGVAGAELILHRKEGDPFVVLAPIFQHSPSILLARKDRGISNIQDLIGKRVMLLPENKDADILVAFLNEGISSEMFHRLDQSYRLEDLIEGRTDAVSAYLTNEPWYLLQQNIEPGIISPQTYGVDFYSDCLFTVQNEIEHHPQRVKAFLKASLLGWEYAMDHPEEIIDLLLTDYGVNKNREHLHFEAEGIRKIMMPDLVQIGHMNPGRWAHIRNTYARLGLIDADFSLKDFLYDPGSESDYTWLKRLLAVMIPIAFVLVLLIFVLLFFNRRLSSEINRRKQIENQLKKSERLHKKAQNVAHIGHWELDSPSGKPLWSEEIFHIFGLDPEKSEPSFAAHKTIIHEDDWHELENAITHLNQKGEPFDLEFRIRRTSGDIGWMHAIGSAEKDDKGSVIRMFGTAQDISDRKHSENQLKSLERRNQALLDYSPVSHKIVDLDLNLQYMSASGFRMLKLDAGSKVYGKPYPFDFFPESFRNEMTEKLEKVKTTGLIINMEALAGDVEGNEMWLDSALIPVLDNQGKIEYLTVVSADITRRKKDEKAKQRLEGQLRQAQKMESVGRLAGGVAHDFNNMLGVILGHTEMALLQTGEDHDLYSALSEIQAAAMRSADITKQLLAFARKQTISPRQLDLNATVESMLNMLRRLIGEDIDLKWQAAGHVWPVKMDPSQIDQILANLCINARDAISGVGKLTIQTGIKTFDDKYCSDHPGFVPGDFVLLAVSDNGCGMDKKILDNLFEPFFTTKDVGKGTGLGLATVYGIVKQNNGFINVYSEPGQGTTFNIYLPRFLTDENSETPVSEKKSAPGGTETILLVEDEPSILRMARTMLENKGYTVLSAATPAEAIEKAKHYSGSIDLLMTDVVMPEMNGRDLAGKIMDLYPDIQCLYMSGYTAEVIAHHGVLDAGVAFIQKPFSMADLEKKLREILDRVTETELKI